MENSDLVDLNSQLFSLHLLEQQKLNKLRSSDEELKHLSHATYTEYSKRNNISLNIDLCSSARGHGPFVQLNDQSIKYDLICSKEGLLIGHSHPLSIKSHLEAAGYSSLYTNRSYLSEVESELDKLAIEGFKFDQFNRTQFYQTKSYGFKAILNHLIEKDKTKNIILVLGEIPEELNFLSMRSSYGELKRGPKDIEIIQIELAQFQDNDLTDKDVISIYKEHRKHLLALFINPESSKNPTFFMQEDLIEIFVKNFKANEIPTVFCELYYFGTRKELFTLTNASYQSDIDYYFIGNNSLLNVLIFNEKSIHYKSNRNIRINISDVIFTKSFFNFLRSGNFYGENGKVLKIEKEFKRKLSQLADEVGSKNIEYESNGLIFSLNLFPGDVIKQTKLYKEILAFGIITEFNNQRFNIYFPITVMNEHLSDICHQLEKAMLRVEGE